MQIKTERNGKTFPRLLTRGHVHLDGIDLDCLACRLWSEDRASQPLPAGPGQPQPRSTHSLPQPARLKCGWQSNLHQEHAGPQTITSLNPSPQTPPRSLLSHRRAGCPAGSPADTGMQAASRRSPDLHDLHTFAQDLSCSLAFGESSPTPSLIFCAVLSKLPGLPLLLVCLCIISSTNTSLIKNSVLMIHRCTFQLHTLSLQLKRKPHLPLSLQRSVPQGQLRTELVLLLHSPCTFSPSL